MGAEPVARAKSLSLRARATLALYRLSFGLAGLTAAAAAPWLGFYSRRVKEGFAHYLGLVPRCRNPRVFWIHAVSMGESMVAYGFAAGLQREFPDYQMIFTSTHPDVIAGARRRGFLASYFPLDTQVSMHRVFERCHPTAVFVCETDFWPEFSTQCRQRRIPLFLINGRISSKLAEFYQNFAGLAELVFGAYTMLAVQSAVDARRLLAAGVEASRVKVLGNMKADLTVAPGSVDLAAIKSWLAQRQTVVVGSLHPGEFNLLLPVFCAQIKQGRAVILAPRNPALAEAWQQQLESSGVACCRRSLGTTDAPLMLLDTMGELAAVYSLADAAFVGGSLVGDVGGHNPLEVIQQSVPLLMGPNCRNFADLVEELKAADAMLSCDDADAVSAAIERVLADKNLADAMIANASQVLAVNRGVLPATLQLVKECLSVFQLAPQPVAELP
ncbi:MAG: 3-deoxy-D-manno-octulosonic acid transferase [Candidatus Rifleibacterium amylolyticum]|nr:MAG: 3-deoxy-D-manno-octulosonic acid transferase [Candidatus Rifleibacterium amylolyticum]